MDISNGAILWSTPSGILTKGKYFILIFRTRPTCMVSMDLWKKKNNLIIYWSIFTEELIAHYGDIKRNTFFSQFVNIWQKGPFIKHIQKFQKLSLKVKNILEDNLLDLFMGTLKEIIQHEVHFFEPKSLHHTFSIARKVEIKNMATRKLVTNKYRKIRDPSFKPTRFS